MSRGRRRANAATDVFRYINMCNGNKEACWEWRGHIRKSDGRPEYYYEGRRITAYRLVYELFTGSTLEKGDMVRHKCDNKLCCNPHHLEKGTHQENMNDMKERERHGLPHQTVRAIKRLLESGAVSHAEIAKRFGKSRELITAIANDRVYQHVSVNDETTENEDE